tara:strand:- start:13432 stop:13956 length:525 start_codon:yes stop_codon:yes gene_type:complete
MNNQAHETLKKNKVMIDFSKQDARNNWRVSNDNVMGGVSKGNIILSTNKVIFKGMISLENNGGFSAVFHDVKPIDQVLNHIMLDFQGDGQQYQIRLITNSFGKQIYYYHEFETLNNQRQKMTFKLTDFQGTFRGKKINDAPTLMSQDIVEIGFLLTKKQAGEFALSLFSLCFIE